jgi:hypothetical protein
VAYSELIKNFTGIRDYMRQFLVYGFRSREEFDAKSLRSYDNEKRRVESWLTDFMSFRQDASGKAVFLSVDSRRIPHNPLYKAWKASGFTKNDISLHFLLLDILANDSTLAVPEILERINADYLSEFEKVEPIDESTLRKKLKEYLELGLVAAEKRGKQLRFSLPENGISLVRWQDAAAFFSEESPLGVIGSYILDKYDDVPDYFSLKHRYLLFALDSGIMLDLLSAIHERRKIELELIGGKNGKRHRATTLPLKIYISVQGGRQYLAAYNFYKKRIGFFRLDSIQKIRPLEVAPDYKTYQEALKEEQPNIWGVATGQGKLEHIEMTLTVAPADTHIARRLEREKRCGTVTKLNETTWHFTADVYDAWELIPWLRTFIGRVLALTCSNKQVEAQFWSDLAKLTALYGGEGDAV